MCAVDCDPIAHARTQPSFVDRVNRRRRPYTYGDLYGYKIGDQVCGSDVI